MDESEIPSLIERNDSLRSPTSCPTDTISFWTDMVPSLQEKSEIGLSIECILSRLLVGFTTLICSLGAIVVGAVLIGV